MKLFLIDCGCEPGWESFDMSCYRIPSEGPQYRNWTSAENYCIERGAHLASIHSDEENDFLTPYARDAPFVFTGGQRTTENSFSWTDGKTFDYEHWEVGQPMDGYDCIGLMHYPGNHPSNGKWGVFPCDSPHDRYICKKPLKGNFQLYVLKEHFRTHRRRCWNIS